MKFEDLKIVQSGVNMPAQKTSAWKPENAKIYKIGFYLLSWGM